MKKVKVVLLASLIILVTTTTSFARAGGGGGGSGGGSSSGGRGSSSSKYTYKNVVSSNNKDSELSDTATKAGAILIFLIIIIAIYSDSYRIKENKLKKQIKKLSKYDEYWDTKIIKSQIRESFYMVQKAWTKGNQEIAYKYCTEYLNQEHKTKLEWMNVRNEINVLDKIKLLQIRIVGVNQYESIEEDSVWVRINASMIDYIEKDGKLVSGSKKSKSEFYEYWKFIKVKDRWLLDKILQDEDIHNINELSNIL